ncbi:MAG TPA: lysozyme inhibitor LprI family protein [Terracidiphilus sp.]|nr:lysozyme inhibitor LprI family protein [Terracidiphilus sp.]
MILLPLSLALMLACTLPAFAQVEDGDSATQARCEEYLQTPLPPEAAHVAAPKQWPECNSYKLYAGIGVKIDYAAARQCAWSERLAVQANLEPRYTVGSVFGGSAMLAVLYANGEGVPKDLKLAERFVCEAGGAPAEIRIRLEHVASLAQSNSPSKSKFDFCDDITSGFMEGFCSAYHSEFEDQRRVGALKEITARFTPEQQLAFQSLLKSEEDYARAHAAGEIDLSGSARAMFQIDAEDTLRDDFIEALRSFEGGKLPPTGAAEFPNADAHLNSVYRQAMSDAESHKNNYGAVQPAGIRDAERAWLRYRDAWVAFAKLRYPSVPHAAWLTLLTNDRTSILDGSFCDMDDVEGPCAPKGDTWRPSPLP